MTLDSLQSTLTTALPALIAFPVYLVIHLLAWQVAGTRWKGTLGLVLCSAVAFCIALPATHVFHPVTFGSFWVSVSLQGALTVLYMHLYFGMDRSLSVRMLGELSLQPDGALTFAELDRVYSSRDMVERRVAVLVEKGLLIEENGKYRCSDKARPMLRFAHLGKDAYGLTSTG
jgi:hypothetical protein